MNLPHPCRMKAHKNIYCSGDSQYDRQGGLRAHDEALLAVAPGKALAPTHNQIARTNESDNLAAQSWLGT